MGCPLWAHEAANLSTREPASRCRTEASSVSHSFGKFAAVAQVEFSNFDCSSLPVIACCLPGFLIFHSLLTFQETLCLFPDNRSWPDYVGGANADAGAPDVRDRTVEQGYHASDPPVTKGLHVSTQKPP